MAACELPPHLQEMYEKNSSELSSDEKFKFKTLIYVFSDIFSKDNLIWVALLVGLNIKSKLMMKGRLPKYFPEPHFIFRDKKKQGVIEPSISEWSAAIVLVRKKSEELRYCIDYRALNEKNS